MGLCLLVCCDQHTASTLKKVHELGGKTFVEGPNLCSYLFKPPLEGLCQRGSHGQKLRWIKSPFEEIEGKDDLPMQTINLRSGWV
ncbi:hypothetical protein Daqu01_03229 [Deinococcus aquaticus]